MRTPFRAVLTAAVLAASIACSNSNPASPSELGSASSSRATFNVGVRPSPITATRCSPQCTDDTGTKSYAFSADMTIDVQDSSSVGATVNSITLTGTADGTTFPPFVLSSDDIKRQLDTNHVDGQAALSLPVRVLYNTPSGNANLDVSVSVQVADDRGNQVTATGQVSVR